MVTSGLMVSFSSLLYKNPQTLLYNVFAVFHNGHGANGNVHFKITLFKRAPLNQAQMMVW